MLAGEVAGGPWVMLRLPTVCDAPHHPASTGREFYPAAMFAGRAICLHRREHIQHPC